MKETRLKQMTVSVLIVLSLFVSSIAACCCDHHQEKTEIKTVSCHSETLETNTKNHFAADFAETKSESKSGKSRIGEINTSCECAVNSAPQVFVKNENVKIEKQCVAIDEFVKLPEAKFAASIIAFESVFTAPFYLSDSFYNHSPGRAPPRL